MNAKRFNRARKERAALYLFNGLLLEESADFLKSLNNGEPGFRNDQRQERLSKVLCLDRVIETMWIGLRSGRSFFGEAALDDGEVHAWSRCLGPASSRSIGCAMG